MKKIKPFHVSVVGLGVALNIIGAFIALNLRLPILLDSIGTIMVSAVLGPYYGILTGVCGSLVSGITFDIYSLYFSPVQIFVGLLSGILFQKGWMKKIKMPIGVLIVSIFSSLVGAIIAAFVFDGVTSSGSSYIVAFLSNIGINKVISVFVVQFLTDYLDKFIAVALVLPMTMGIPQNIKEKIIRS
ncbi:ECF transporter S component [Inediibacterium massiliense]|uniref:ECF transporter S component n=1 Tax=Inediibacterium massiliense TaxID=1658111 RepID=UPI0006B64B4E|nr:ECF transporter S component [Inediibacterium massiliense]